MFRVPSPPSAKGRARGASRERQAACQAARPGLPWRGASGPLLFSARLHFRRHARRGAAAKEQRGGLPPSTCSVGLDRRLLMAARFGGRMLGTRARRIARRAVRCGGRSPHAPPPADQRASRRSQKLGGMTEVRAGARGGGGGEGQLGRGRGSPIRQTAQRPPADAVRPTLQVLRINV
jgi:hypothetical protein